MVFGLVYVECLISCFLHPLSMCTKRGDNVLPGSKLFMVLYPWPDELVCSQYMPICVGGCDNVMS